MNSITKEAKDLLLDKTPEELRACHDCAAKPGTIHLDGCDVERCSVCGGQKLQCDLEKCKDHDKAFARWTGIWPGAAEADFLGMDLNELATSGIAKIIFKKPKPE